jgi:Kef-type K+ transport system membrane component KefB
VLSQLESLTGTINAAGILIPVVSAVVFLVVGGYVALFIAPGVVEKYVLRRVEPEHHGKVELAIMFGILLVMMPATHYAKASYLMGAFVAGLAFCTSHELHLVFVQQFKRLMQWLMRIFFAASIGFQVPVKDFAVRSDTIRVLFTVHLELDILNWTPWTGRVHYLRNAVWLWCFVSSFSFFTSHFVHLIIYFHSL